MIGLESKLVAKYGASGSAIGTVNGPSIDTKGFYAALVVLSAGAFTATGTLAVKVQHSSDNNVGDAWADLAGAAFTTLTDATDENVVVGRLKLDGNTCERYIRIVGVVATAAAPYGVSVVLKGKQYLPQTDEAAEFTV
jgi:hypothetical protein